MSGREDGAVKGAALLDLCKEALRAAGEADAEVFASNKTRGCARFAIGELGQHMDIRDPKVVVRVARGARVAEARTSQLEVGAITQALRDAAAAARFVPETEGFPGFAGKGEPHAAPPRFDEATAAATPEQRAEMLAPVLRSIRDAGFVSAGMLETTTAAYAVATTAGCARSHDATQSSFKVWALETAGAGGSAGFGTHMDRSVARLHVAEETERAIRMCRLGLKPGEMDEGTYDVVMEPAAVAELLEWLSAIAFGAPEVEQGGSPMRLGETITGEGVTLAEDPLDGGETGFGVPFDREGTPRARVPLIERGVAKAILYDRTYAARRGTLSTGSALADNEFSSVGAGALHLAGGEAGGVDELIAGIDRGLYVCRLHYVNGLLETPRAVMTGLTRDGCFLVEKGKIVRGLGNMRFTDSFLEGLARCDGMTRACRAIPTWWTDIGAVVAPAIRMRAFRFNGRSQRPASLA